MNIFKKKDGNNSEETTQKKKLVFAKDRKQGIIAIIITTLFIGNTVYMIVKYLQQKQHEAELAKKQKVEFSAESFSPRTLQYGRPLHKNTKAN